MACGSARINGMSDSAVVRAHLEQILASPGFANAERLRRFLTYVTEAHLRGESGQLKEYVLGREVFDRDESYDPRLDPIVRVEARRLRQRLEEYYAGPGREARMRLSLPKGAYSLNIDISEPRGRRASPWIGAAAVLLLGLGGYFYTLPAVPRQAVAVVPARWTFVDPSGLHAADEPLAEAVTAEVANRGRVAVIGWPSVLQFRSQPKQSPEVAKATGASMVLALSVRQTGAQSRVTVFLVEPFTGRKRWAEDFYAQDLNGPSAYRDLARTIAHDLELALGVAK